MKWDWLPAILHCIYWVSLIHLYSEKWDNEDQSSHFLLTFRLMHFGMMGSGCFFFTLVAILYGQFAKTYPSPISKVENGNSHHHYSPLTTSYVQHSSSAEERKFMQQQLMQFNAQSQECYEQNSSSSLSQPLLQQDQPQQQEIRSAGVGSSGQQVADSQLLPLDQRPNLQNSKQHRSCNNTRDMKREEFKIKSNNRFKSDNYGSSHISLKGSGLQGEQNHERQSFVRINGKVQVTKDERTLKMKGWLSWSIVFNNYRLHFLIILSAVFSALSQIIMTYAVDLQIEYNDGKSFSTNILCWIQVASFSMILLVFSFTHQFLIAPDMPDAQKQPEENLAQGIYFIFSSLTTALIANLYLNINKQAFYFGMLAFILLGVRLIAVKTLISMRKEWSYMVRSSCSFINLLHLWTEFLVFAIAYYFCGPQQDFNVQLVYEKIDKARDFCITMIYLAYIALSNKALQRQSLFTYSNQQVMHPTIICLGLLLFSVLDKWLLFQIVGLIFLYFIIKLIYQGCKNFLQQKLASNRQRKTYGLQFQEDQYDRLLPTPYTSGAQDLSQSADLGLRMPQPEPKINYEYYIVENEVSLLLKKRACLDVHYKYNSIQHYSLKFYAISSFDLSQSHETNHYQERQDEQQIFLKAIENYHRRIFS